MNDEYKAFLHKLTVAKDIYTKKEARSDFLGFLKRWKFLDTKSPYYVFDDYYKTFFNRYIKGGIYNLYKDEPEVQAIFEQVEEHFKKSSPPIVKLTEAGQKRKDFLDAIEFKKSNINISQKKKDEIQGNIAKCNEYKFKNPFDANYFFNLNAEEKWFFAIGYLEKNFDSPVNTPFVNQNYDLELPVVIRALTDKARIKILFNMGIKKHPVITDKTLDIKQRIETIIRGKNATQLIEKTTEFFLKNQPYKKHLYRATGFNRFRWKCALNQLYKEDEKKYMQLILVLSDNSTVGIERSKKAFSEILPLVISGEINAYNYSMTVPETRAGDLFGFIMENQGVLPEDERIKIVNYFFRNCTEYMEIDINEKSNYIVSSSSGEQKSGKDICDFLCNNYINMDLGSFNYVASYFAKNGEFPAGRTQEQIIEIKTKISVIRDEVSKIQNNYITEVLVPIEKY